MFRGMIAGIAFVVLTYKSCDAVPFIRTDKDVQQTGQNGGSAVSMVDYLSEDDIPSKFRKMTQLLESLQEENILAQAIENNVFSKEGLFSTGQRLQHPGSIMKDSLLLNKHTAKYDNLERRQSLSSKPPTNLQQKSQYAIEESEDVKTRESLNAKRRTAAKFAMVNRRGNGYKTRSKRQIDELLARCGNVPECIDKLRKAIQFHMEHGYSDITGIWHV